MSNEDKPTFIPCIRNANISSFWPIYTLHPPHQLFTQGLESELLLNVREKIECLFSPLNPEKGC